MFFIVMVFDVGFNTHTHVITEHTHFTDSGVYITISDLIDCPILWFTDVKKIGYQKLWLNSKIYLDFKYKSIIIIKIKWGFNINLLGLNIITIQNYINALWVLFNILVFKILSTNKILNYFILKLKRYVINVGGEIS